MKRFAFGVLVALALLFCAPSASAQTYLRVPADSYGFCWRLGAPGDQAISASCTVTVYEAGTLTLADIFSDDMGTMKVNPFAGATNGTWLFYGESGMTYDIRISGGSPAVTPYTIAGVEPGGVGTGSVTSFSSGNLSPLFTTNVANPTSTPALSFTQINQSPNLIFSGPASGGAAAPTFRALAAADFPSPFVPPNDNMTDLGSAALQWRTGYFGTSLISPVYRSKAADPADTGVLRLGNTEAICAELATPGADGCITFDASDRWAFSNRIVNVDGALATPAYSFSSAASSGMYWSGTQLCLVRIGVGEICTNGGPGTTSLNQMCVSTTTRCILTQTMPTTLNPAMAVRGGAEAFGLPLVGGNINCGGCGNDQKGYLYFNTTTNVARYWNGTALRDFGSNIFDCGTTDTCANTATTAARTIIGSVALSSGTPSTAVVTGISPAFTSTTSYRCVVTEATTATNNLLKVVNTSTSSFTITGPDTLTDTIHYICAGS